MKNSIKFLGLVLLGLVASISCQKNEMDRPNDGEGVFFSLRTGDASKTYIVADGKGFKPQWAEGDEIGVLFEGFATGKESPAGILKNSNESGSTAKFEGTIEKVAESGTLYAFYPAKFYKTYADQTVGFDIVVNQKPTATSFDPAADLLISKPVVYSSVENAVEIDGVQFARALALLKINVYSSDFAAIQGQYLNKLTVTAVDDTLTGRPVFDLTKGDAKITKYNKNSESVNALYDEDIVGVGSSKEGAGSVFLMVAPVTLNERATLKFEGETEGYKFSKEVALPKDILLNPGRLTEINLSIAESNCEKKVAETRIWVENFENCTENKTKYEVSVTGAKGTGLTENTSYDYGSGDIRINNNGHSGSDPYLYVPGSNTFTVKNLSVSEETTLILSAQTKNAGVVTLKCKESAAETWTEIGSWTSTSSFSEQKTIFTIAGTATSIDLSFTASASIIIDDIVLEKFVDQRTTLTTPANVKAEVDANTSNKINVTWDAVENAGSYEVTLQTSGEEDAVDTATENSISFTGLKYATPYSVKVKAISSDVSLYKDSEYSEPVNVTTGEQPAVMIDWVKKSFADLAAGDEVVIVKTSDTPYAMSNDKGTSDAPTAVAVSVSNDKLGAEPGANIIWYVGIDGSNKIFNKDEEGSAWLYCTGTNNGVRVGTNTAKTFTWDDTNYLKHVGTSRYLGVYNDQDWRCYSTTEPSTHTNLKDQAFAFFVKNDPRTALATPEITVTPDNTAKKITVTWNTVANAADYTVTCGQAEKTETGTSCEFTGLAYGDYTVTVQANPAAGSTTHKSSEKASKNVSIVDTTPVINASNPAAVEATATSVEVSYTVTNKVEGTNLTAAVTSGDWISNPQVAADKVTFTLSANTSSEQRTGKVTLSYAGAKDKVVTITQKGAGQVGYASLEDLVAAGEPKSGDDAENVTVTFSNKKIIEIQGNRKGIWLSVAGAPNDKIEIYPNVVMPEDWVVGGIVTATLTNCKWVKFNASTWELCPSNWNDITYVGPVATPEIALDGANATITCATAGATILYEISDTEPASFTHTYSSAVTLEDGQTIWAKATLAGHPDSKVASKKYTAGGSTKIELKFSLTSNPGNWPTANSTTLTNYTYTLDNVNYTFGLNNVKCNSGYLMLTSTAVLGLPAIDGKKLTKVVVKNSSGCSTSTKVGISSSSSSASYISGGAVQTWSTTSSTYTYTLTGTSDNTVYYLYVTNKNAQIIELTLTYE